MRQNIFSTFIEDRLGILTREMIGEDNRLVFRLPPQRQHLADSPPIIETQFEGVPNPVKRKMIAENAARLYKLN